MKAKLSMVSYMQNNGSYYAVCPELTGCYTQGDTYEQAYSNLKELVEITINEELDEASKIDIAQSKMKIFSEFEVEIGA